MAILTVNVGSSSVRLAAYAGADECVAREQLAGNSDPPARRIENFLKRAGIPSVEAAAHRVVHGGERFTAACRIDAAVEAEIERLAELAPLHNPAGLRWIRACREALGADMAQFAVFDTAFYSGLPEVARTYALPAALAQIRRGGSPVAVHLRRFGFHGLAHSHMWQQWQAAHRDRRNGRVISLQLGSGCSITATCNGAAVDTSMGFSPLEGLVMATRAGDVDPGLLLYLQRSCGMTAEDLERVLNQESGLRGMSGRSGDMRELLAADDARARLAIEVYCYRARKYVGAYLAALGGADAILFGGGVGEHAPQVRAKILEGLSWAGIVVDATRNAAAAGRQARIEAMEGRVEIWVAPVDEAVILAQETRPLLAAR